MPENLIGPIERGWSRRDVVRAIGAATGVAAATRAAVPPPPSTVTTPPRDFGPNAPLPLYFNDPDVVVVDPSFSSYVQPNAVITRLWTGALWAEGPAWSSVGRYLVF